MKHKPAFSRSSLLVSVPFLVGSPIAGVLAAFFGQTGLAALFLLLFLLAAACRLWADWAARDLEVTVSGGPAGLFPGEEMEVEVTVHNAKAFPVAWLEAWFPLSPRLCLLPQGARVPEEWELPELKELGASEDLVGEKRFSFLSWYETLSFTTRWTARNRGLYSTAGWRLRTGDGFGLTQTQRPIFQTTPRRIAVYPKLVGVSPDLFLRNQWNADTGARGVMEDITVIRSTRDYQTTDPVKRINWRLAARGLPVTVNVYEDILPQSIHFLLDGESFRGTDPQDEALEETLSILASEFVLLWGRQVACGLSLCRGGSGRAVNYFSAGTEELLFALAGYLPLPLKLDGADGKIVPQPTVFDEGPIWEAARKIGHFYYIALDTDGLAQNKLLQKLDPARTTVLTFREPGPLGPFETVCLARLKEDKSHG